MGAFNNEHSIGGTILVLD